MPEQLPFTALLNRIFGGVANALLDAVHVQHDPQAPIADFVAMQILVVALLLLVFLIVRSRLSGRQTRRAAAHLRGPARLHHRAEPRNHRAP